MNLDMKALTSVRKLQGDEKKYLKTSKTAERGFSNGVKIILIGIVLTSYFMSISSAQDQDEEYDKLILKNGSVLVGTIVKETQNAIEFKKKGSANILTYPKNIIARIKRAPTLDEIKERKRNAIVTHVDRLEFAKWCDEHNFKNDAYLEAKKVTLEKKGFKEAYEFLARYFQKKWQDERVVLAANKKKQDAILNEELKLYIKAKKFGVESADVDFRLASIYYKLKFFKVAEALLKKASLSFQKSNRPIMERDARNMLGELYLHMREYDVAIKEFKRVLEFDEHAFHGLFGLGRCHFYKGEYQKAEEFFAKAKNIDTGHPEMFNYLGVNLYWQEKYDEALKNFIKAFELISDREVRLQAQIYTNIGLICIKKGDLEKAKQNFKYATKADSSFPEALWAWGYALEEDKKAYDGLLKFIEATRLQERKPQSYYYLAKAYQRRGNWKAAKESILLARKNGFDYETTYKLLGALSAKQGKFQDAINYLKLALIKKRSLENLYNFGMALLFAEKYLEAKIVFEEILDKKKNHIPALSALSYIAFNEVASISDKVGLNYTKKLLEKILKKDPKNTFAKGALQKIEKWEALIAYRENFNSPDSETIGNKWEETEGAGVDIVLKEGKVLFKGTQGKNWRKIQLFKIGTSKRFVGFEANIEIKKVKSARIGIRIKGDKRTGGEIVFFRDSDGTLACVKKETEKEEKKALGKWQGGLQKLRIELFERNEGIFKLFFGKKEVASITARNLMRAKEFKFGIYGQAPKGEDYEFEVDNVVFFYEKEGGVEKRPGY